MTTPDFTDSADLRWPDHPVILTDYPEGFGAPGFGYYEGMYFYSYERSLRSGLFGPRLVERHEDQYGRPVP